MEEKQPPKTCAVEGCTEANPQKIYNFPHNSVMRQLWMESCGLDQVGDCQGVCQAHFTPSDLQDEGPIPGAVPDTTTAAQTAQFLETLDQSHNEIEAILPVEKATCGSSFTDQVNQCIEVILEEGIFLDTFWQLFHTSIMSQTNHRCSRLLANFPGVRVGIVLKFQQFVFLGKKAFCLFRKAF